LTRQATLWIYGEGEIALALSSPTIVSVRLLADGRLADEARFAGAGRVSARLRGMGWHSLLFDSSTAGVRLGETAF
jgi:hypothetical protein